MATIEVYARPMCGFCAQAKRLLNQKGSAFAEFDIWAEPGKREEMIQRANGRSTVPQIFIDGQHIGGCDDLMALERAGKLDALLESAA